jgi:hypothetical protein
MVTEESRELANITGVQLAMQGTLHIMLGSSENLRIEAEDNLMEYIQTNLRASNLVIETRQGINLNNTRPIDYYLTVKRLNSIVISSSGDIDTGDLQSDSFSVTINSVSNLMSDSISVRISSSGDLEIKGGQVQNQNITISSSGEYRARSLTSVDANVTLTSSGEATIRVSDHLSGRLSSSGDIYYIGSPDLNVSTSSSGRAVKISD